MLDGDPQQLPAGVVYVRSAAPLAGLPLVDTRTLWTRDAPLPAPAPDWQRLDLDHAGRVAFARAIADTLPDTADLWLQAECARVGRWQAARNLMTFLGHERYDPDTWVLFLDASANLIGVSIPDGYLGLIPACRGAGAQLLAASAVTRLSVSNEDVASRRRLEQAGFGPGPTVSIYRNA